MCGPILTRRRVLSGAGATVLAAAAGRGTAQTYPILCSWAGGNWGSGLAEATPRARADVFNIIDALRLNGRLQVFRGGVPNAAATIIQGYPAVIYNPDFLGRLYRCNPAAPLTVLAHEVGHHANNDTHFTSQFEHPWHRELGADFVSGVAMRRLGVGLSEAQTGIACSFGRFSPGSPSHPDSQRRLAAIHDGWMAG